MFGYPYCLQSHNFFHSEIAILSDADFSFKGREWINRASKGRTSAWKVSNEHPGVHTLLLGQILDYFSLCLIDFYLNSLGYNASDSDSDEAKGDANRNKNT